MCNALKPTPPPSLSSNRVYVDYICSSLSPYSSLYLTTFLIDNGSTAMIYVCKEFIQE